jgi:hypothetical protein
MKNNFLFILALAILVLANSCKPGKDTTNTTPGPGNATIKFAVKANGNALQVGAAPNIINSLGQKFSVNVLKYYISSIRLMDDKGVETNLNNNSLLSVDLTNPKSEIAFPNLPAGNYTSIQFNFGLDAATNAQANGSGDLDHFQGMWWGTEKYLFLKHEGNYIDKNNMNSSLLFHIGSDYAYEPNITLPISGLTIDRNTKTILIDFNIDKMYDGVDFNINNNMMSAPKDDAEILDVLTTNIKTAFAFKAVQ